MSSVLPWHSWNWSGDEIIHSPVILACRPIPGRRKRYNIDIREYLTTTSNAVVADALRRIVRKLRPREQALFRSHHAGSFNFRADTIARFVGTLRYLSEANRTVSTPDAWLFPDETLAQGGGDCEDLAFLLAALLMASGISSYCIRVALGRLQITLPDGQAQPHDHCWVMYQNEAGVWEILEPLARLAPPTARPPGPAAPAPAVAVEYVPQYVFNTDHLWFIRSPDANPGVAFTDYCGNRAFWKHFDPQFAASVHDTIFDKAIGDLASAAALQAIKRKSFCLDANIATYDPRDHCDDGYLDEGWALANDRLAEFNADNTDWDSFGAAGHTIGDFYAHSSYTHFAQLQNPAAPDGQPLLYAPGQALAATPDYGPTPDPAVTPFDLTSGAFTRNTELWSGTREEAAARWAGQLISGRYAQRYDPWATFFEGFTSIPFSLSSAPGYADRGSLPHHDEIAVDSATMKRRHRLYQAAAAGPDDRRAYANQFRWRFNAAVQHIRQAFQENWHGATG